MKRFTLIAATFLVVAWNVGPVFSDDIAGCLLEDEPDLCFSDYQGGNPAACTPESSEDDNFHSQSAILVYGPPFGGIECDRYCSGGTSEAYDFYLGLGSPEGYLHWELDRNPSEPEAVECSVGFCTDEGCESLAEECPPEELVAACGDVHGTLGVPAP